MSACLYITTSYTTSTQPIKYYLTIRCRSLNPYGGGILPPRRTFYPVALKPLGIVTKAFVTFPECMWAKKMLKKIFQISPLVFPIWRLENGHPTKKARKSYIKVLFGF